MKKMPDKKSRLVAATLLAAAVTLLASLLVFQLDIPNPVIILVAVMIFFTALVNNVAGAASGICIILYAGFFFSENHSFIHFTQENRTKFCVILLSLLVIYIMVALIRRRSKRNFQRLESLNESLEQQNEDLEHASDHDALTGIYNRRGGDRQVALLLQAQQNGSVPYQHAILAAIDIDDFKSINDLHGHAAGDEALLYFARCLQENFPDNSVLIRNGGDEFQAFLYGDLQAMETRLQAFTQRNFSFAFQQEIINFNISCGYVVYPDQVQNQKDLYRKADVALYTVKFHGKHQALRYTVDIDVDTRGRQAFSMGDFSRNLPVAFLIYRADESEQILLASSTLLELCECDSFQEFLEYTGGTFHGFVNPGDVEEVEKNISEQIQVNNRGLDIVDYRIQTRNGRTVRIRDLGRLVHDTNVGDLFYVVLYDMDALSALQ